jgi:hypothetical protein
VTDKKLGTVSGVETLKTLAGAVGIASFTVRSLAQRTGVSRETVDTVLRRHRGAFKRLNTIPGGGRGRPQVRWQLRSDAIDEVVAEVQRLQGTIGGEPYGSADRPEPDLVEASLTMAADSVLRAPVDDPDTARLLIATARASLVAAGFDDVLSDTSQGSLPGASPEEERARLINAVADVVEADLTGDPAYIDLSQAKALPLVREAKASMSAEQWLPLANQVIGSTGTVLAAPVCVPDPNDRSLIEKMFPWLTPVYGAKVEADVDDGTPASIANLVLADRRLAPSAYRLVLPSVVVLQVLAEPMGRPATVDAVSALLRKKLLAPSSSAYRLPKHIVFAEHIDAAIMSSITDSGARLVLIEPKPRETQTNFARAVNRVAVGLDS